MALLLDRRSDEVKITEDVLKEAASNGFGGFKVLQLLHRTVSIKVTVGVIEAAATSGQEQILDLLDRWDSIGSDKERWLNISRLYNAAKYGDAATVRRLLLTAFLQTSEISMGKPLCGRRQNVAIKKWSRFS